MNPTDAIRLMVQHYPGGHAALAVLCGKNPDTLRHEISGKHASFKLGVADCQVISAACIEARSPHCYAYVDAVNSNAGGRFVPLDEAAAAQGAANLHADAAGLVRECSDVLSEVTKALVDGQISDNERRAIERELTELLAQVRAVQSDVASEHARTLRSVGQR